MDKDTSRHHANPRFPAPAAEPDPLDPSGYPALGEQEAERRLKAEGPNALPGAKSRSGFAFLLDLLREPMFFLLLGSATLYLILGDRGEALALFASVLLMAGLTVFQERRTERTLEKLRDLSSPRALVFRNGAPRRISGFEVVRGDLLVLSEGDRVAADGKVLASSHFRLDESLLTGESVPVLKAPGEGRDDRVYSGTLAVGGRGLVRVVETGGATRLGQIGRSLEDMARGRTRVQAEIDALIRYAAFAALFLSLGVALVWTLREGSPVAGLLAGLTLAIALVPEEFPVVLTVFMALGAWRMSARRVLVRRSPVLEALGSASVLCVDKTGTLTRNQMVLRALSSGSEYFEGQGQAGLPEAFHLTAEFAILASQRDPFDPMERAFHSFGKEHLAGTEHLHGDWALVREYPLSPELLALSHVWRSPGGETYVVAAKGAPEAVVDLCHLDPMRAAAVAETTGRMARKGLRVLGVARAYFKGEALPGIQHDFDFEFLGLAGLEDPLRDGVFEAVRACREAGIRLIMLTGDHPETAGAVAEKLGFPPKAVLIGSQLETLDPRLLTDFLGSDSVFARIQPEQKLKLVRALQAMGEVVAMTGDGVNDAPALKAANIGIAMGGRGTDVAREAADLVVTDDDFSSIVEGIRMGRRIFDNLRKALAYIVAVHVPVAGMSLIPALLGWPLAILPLHVVFFELIIDPACSVAFEAEPGAADLMKRPPRPADQSLFGWPSLLRSLVQGLCALGGALLVFGMALGHGRPLGEVRAMGFTALVASNLGMILLNRGRGGNLASALSAKNRALWGILSGAFLLLGLVLFMPGPAHLFGFVPTSLSHLLLAAAGGLGGLLLFEALVFLRGYSFGHSVTLGDIQSSN